ncbi:exodeoxyribonuclease VII small subunit [Humibacter ginsengiterrae]
MPSDSTALDSAASGSPASGTDAGTADLSYEQARDELIGVVSRLEQGTSTLEESLALWERGEALARRCEEWLIGAKARLDAARAGVDSSASSDAPREDPF